MPQARRYRRTELLAYLLRATTVRPAGPFRSPYEQAHWGGARVNVPGTGRAYRTMHHAPTRYST